MIYPTLFIGLGSTGLDIIERFQELVLEHYGRASLDIFKYIAIETREAAEVKQSEWGENEINLLKPVIKSTDSIDNAIKSGEKKPLQNWLNTELLKIEGGQFTDGASNIRMGGRLILWENWDNIKMAINNAYNQVTTVQNKRQTEVFLNEHYVRHGQAIDDRQPLVGSLPNIYIVGTLCGGTCSGMFIDIGYYTKLITGLWARNLPDPDIAKVIGVFSVFDAATLNSAQQESIKGNAANCWAALKEYDFFCHPQTRYQVAFPGEQDIDTNERPIDYLYLLSCSASDGGSKLKSNLRKKDGSPDEKSLNHMAATLLFTETVGTLLGTKEAIRTDYRGKARAIARNNNEHSPCVATCGIATVWYPKYRIALGTACKYGSNLSVEWKGEVDPNTNQIIKKDTKSKWYDMLTQRIDILTSSPMGTIIGELKQEIDKSGVDTIQLSAQQFREHLQSMILTLNKGEKYDNHINEPKRVSNFKKMLMNDIYGLIEDIINSESNITYAEHTLKQLDKSVAGTIKQFPSEYPDPDLDIIEDISSDIFGKLVFKAREIEKQNRKDILSKINIYMENHIKNIRNYRMSTVLEEIREEIGVGKKLPAKKSKAGKLTLMEHLLNIQKSLDFCIKFFDRRYDDLCKDMTFTQDVKVVSQGGSETIKYDIDKLVAQLHDIDQEQKETIIDNIRESQSLSQFLGIVIEENGFVIKENRTESIKATIMEHMIREVLGRIETFDVVNHIMNNWTASEISEFSKHGLPHLELTPGNSGLASIKIGKSVSFISGGNEKGLENLLQNKLRGTSTENLFRSQKSPVFSPEISHMVLFYREEPLIYMDENIATAALFEKCFKHAERNTHYGIFTHRGGKSIFDPKIYARRDRTKHELMPVATNILSIRNNNGSWTSSDIFAIEKGRLVLRGTRKNTAKFRLTGDEKGIELCAQEKEIYEYLSTHIEEQLENMSREEFYKRLNIYIDWIEKKAEEDESKDTGKEIEENRKNIMKIGLIKTYFPEETED